MTLFNISPALDGNTLANLSLKERLGSGGVASVYRERIGNEYYAVKIYNDRSNFETAKIEYMISHPPSDAVREFEGRKYPRYAWPLALLKGNGPSTKPVIGYAMLVIDAEKSKTLDFFYDHNLSKNLKNANSKALSFRIEILKNLSELIEELHRDGHVFVDLKPQNVRVFEGTNIVTFLDCDGFTIGENDGAKKFPSTMVSPDYVAPEVMRRTNSSGPIGVEQDEYALAVIIFQMLNNGIHPFQGVLKDPRLNAPTNDDKAAMGLYPHGITADHRITHRPQSIHDTLLDETRFLFDRAFVPGNTRPSASEWKSHFDKILSQKLLVRCSSLPTDTAHIRFRDKGCPACKVLQYRAAQPPVAPKVLITQNGSATASPLHKPPTTNNTNDNLFIIIIAIFAIIGIYGFLGYFGNSKNGPSVAPTSNNQSSVDQSSGTLVPLESIEHSNRRIKADAVVRSRPDFGSDNLWTVHTGDTVIVIGRTADQWRQIEMDKGSVGYLPPEAFGEVKSVIEQKPPTPETSGPFMIARPNWVRRPSDRDIIDHYPDYAERAGIEGKATVSCNVTASGTLEGCFVVSEDPIDQGFGSAALAMSSLFHMRSKSLDGNLVAGGTVSFPVRFELPKAAPAAADTVVQCGDHYTQMLSKGPPFCEGHGGIAGIPN